MELPQSRFGPWLAFRSKTSTFRFNHLTSLESDIIYINEKEIKNATRPCAPSVPSMHQVAPSAKNKIFIKTNCF